MSTIIDLLRSRSHAAPRASALLASGRPPSTYEDLAAQVERCARTFRAVGLGPRARIAVSLPNGPEAAAATLSVAASATCAPLNPDYRAEELRFYLTDARADAVVFGGDETEAVRLVASELGLRVFEVAIDLARPAGCFDLRPASDPVDRITDEGPVQADEEWPAPEEVALILHTSGTTARPKVVPLSQANLVASATSIAKHLSLGPQDRALNVMPLFHIHGLVGSLMATLASGGSVACTSRFDPEAFFDQVAEFEPTWFSAVPSMHQALVANGRAYRERAPLHRFRFARSSSASLPPTTLAALEALLECPVIEAYGMTEASHQIASNPLPPRERRAGSVGLPVGAEVAILDESGAELPHGQTGEIAIRGGSVTAGYENNPEANAGAFVRGWFRTGDQGRRDADGYLHIVGRLKEMINRGGEKISPREIDEALLELPGVAQAVAFGFPHPTLGEDVAAALVLEPGAPADAGVVKRALLSRLSAHKVPSRIVFVDRLPKTTTGKVQRMSLHKILPERSREASATEEDPPMSDAERAVASIWCEVLGVESVHARDNFFDLGGDSIRARRAIALIAKRTGKRLPARQMVHLTLAQIAAELPRAKSTRMEKVRQLVRGA